MPASSATLAGFLAELANEGRTLATLRLHRAAIVKAHVLAEQPSHDGPVVAAVLKGLGRLYGKSQRQAPGLTADVLAAIRATAKIRRRGKWGWMETPEQAARRAAFDVALAEVMRDGLLRVSEAAALTWGDVSSEADGSGRLTIRHSKTDIVSEGSVVYLGVSAMESLAALRLPNEDADAPVFGLCARQLGQRLKAAARSAGLGDSFSGHSPRVGMAQDLSAAGMELPALMEAGRWSSLSMPSRYTRNQALSRGAVARYYGA